MRLTLLQIPKPPRRARFLPKPAKAKSKRRIPEWRLQAEVISTLHKLEGDGWPITCAGDMNAGKRGKKAAGQAKVTGLTAGEPDVRLYLPAGRLKMAELKAEDGVLSDAQIQRHARLAELGHDVELLELTSIAQARVAAIALVKRELGR